MDVVYAGHSLDGVGLILPPHLLMLWDGLPVECQIPLEDTTIVDVFFGHGSTELEVVLVDDDDIRAYHRSGLFHDAGQQGL